LACLSLGGLTGLCFAVHKEWTSLRIQKTDANNFGNLTLHCFELPEKLSPSQETDMILESIMVLLPMIKSVCTVVACSSKKHCDDVYSGLKSRFKRLEEESPAKYPKKSLVDLLVLTNGDKTMTERMQALDRLTIKAANIVVTTAVLQRSIPIEADVLIFRDFPDRTLDFIQWIGRAK
jgi:superfamily II DNA/RNA helicase